MPTRSSEKEKKQQKLKAAEDRGRCVNKESAENPLFSIKYDGIGTNMPEDRRKEARKKKGGQLDIEEKIKEQAKRCQKRKGRA